jgi:membrane-associated phospholipid phosphatase
MELAPVVHRQARGWSVRVVLTITYVVATFAYTNYLARSKGYAYNGAVDYLGAIPTDREVIVLWMVGIFTVNLIGRPRRAWLTTFVSWAPFLVALFLYDFARSVGFRIHGSSPMMVVPQIRADEFLGGGRLPTTILQERLYNPDRIYWYDVVVSGVYTSHFLMPYLFAGFLWVKNQRMWRWYAGVFVGVNFTSCLIFALVTTAPPWYASQAELIPEFERVIAGRGWSKIGLNLMSRVIDKGQDTVNPFAAIPSLHSAQALLIVICVSPFVWKWLRPFLMIYPLTMTFALVYSGEHYLIDVFVGWALVAGAFGVGWLLRRRFGWANPFVQPKRNAVTGRANESLDENEFAVPT